MVGTTKPKAILSGRNFDRRKCLLNLIGAAAQLAQTALGCGRIRWFVRS
jgi:hypothetical protein